MTLELQLRTLRATYRRQVRTLVVIRSIWLAALAGLALLYADLFFQFNDPSRLFLDLVFVASLIIVAVLTRHWLTRATDEERRVARLIEEGNPELHNDLINAIDFEESLQKHASQPVSKELMQQQIGIASEKVGGIKRFDSLKPPSLKKEGCVLLGSAALALILKQFQFAAA